MTAAPSSDTDVLSAKVITVALIGPNEVRRKLVASELSKVQSSATREFTSYPGLDDVPKLLDAAYEAIIIELDSNSEHALDLVECICSSGTATVMVYSETADAEMLVRCMRVGAREFLTLPVTSTTIVEALVRASVRRPLTPNSKKVGGKQFLFLGAKGGVGTTTIASNFALMLSRESGQSTCLIDLNLPLGDAALLLGIKAQYSIVNALQNSARLDANFLSTLLTKHSSGLFVLAAPDGYTDTQISPEAITRLLTIARQNFTYVVVDAGSRFDPGQSALVKESAAVYLVTQVGISELRNSNRLVSELLSSRAANIEIVLNRYAPRTLGIDEESLAKALTMPAKWKIPGDVQAAQNAQNTATPLAMSESPISRVIRQMAGMACGSPKVTGEKKKRLSWFS